MFARLLRFAALPVLISGAALAQQAPPTSNPGVRGGTSPTQATVRPSAAEVAAQMRSNGGSFLQAAVAANTTTDNAATPTLGFFAVPPAPPRSLKKHDLVTIIVREESAFSSSGTTDTKKSMDLDAKLESWISLRLSQMELKGIIPGGATIPEIKGSANRDFHGEATVDRSDSLTLRVQAEIIDIKPNGTLVVQAQKTIQTDEEVQQFVLTGTCRAEDVSTDNTVLSTQLSDLDVQKMHKGAVTDTTKRGFVPRLLDQINPF